MLKKLLLLNIGLFFIPSIYAAELNSGDTSWILTSTALVLFMTLPGLALFYGGLVRSKNVLSVLMQCFAIACLISVCWVVYGYSLAFKGDGLFIGDLSAAFLNGVG
ncbi:ammonia channel protein, partial [Gammaproteobacteria bacterium]|nr:ammonia channel protein [Gammaproteobacteria bacterium]